MMTPTHPPNLTTSLPTSARRTNLISHHLETRTLPTYSTIHPLCDLISLSLLQSRAYPWSPLELTSLILLPSLNPGCTARALLAPLLSWVVAVLAHSALPTGEPGEGWQVLSLFLLFLFQTIILSLPSTSSPICKVHSIRLNHLLPLFSAGFYKLQSCSPLFLEEFGF